MTITKYRANRSVHVGLAKTISSSCGDFGTYDVAQALRRGALLLARRTLLPLPVPVPVPLDPLAVSSPTSVSSSALTFDSMRLTILARFAILAAFPRPTLVDSAGADITDIYL